MQFYVILLLIAASAFMVESSPGHKSKSTAVHSKKHQSNLEIVPESFGTKSKSTEFLPIIKKGNSRDVIAPVRRTKRQNNGQKIRPVHGAGQPSRRDGNRRPGPTQHKPIVHQYRPVVRPANYNVRKAANRPPVHHASHRPSAVHSVHPSSNVKPVHAQHRPGPVLQKNGPSTVQKNQPQKASAARPSPAASTHDRFAGGRAL